MLYSISDCRSSLIKSLQYDTQYKQLLVQFEKGTKYLYADIPAWEFEVLLKANSMGQAFNKLIASNGYHYLKVPKNFKL